MSPQPHLEAAEPNAVTVLKIVWHAAKSCVRERPGQILTSAFLLLMAWGYHGEFDILHEIWPRYTGPSSVLGPRQQLIPGIPWDNELISFVAGLFLVVIVPLLIVHFGFRQKLSDYGVGLPPKGRRKLAVWTFLTLTVLSLPAFYLGARNPDMQKVYPFYRDFTSTAQFALYELSYFPFFLAIEFIFRGYLLFGLEQIRHDQVQAVAGGTPAPYFFGKYALLIQMLSYTAWHLGKPLPELWGTLVWGIAAGATAWAVRSIWPIVLSHWLLNVLLDYLIIRPHLPHG